MADEMERMHGAIEDPKDSEDVDLGAILETVPQTSNSTLNTLPDGIVKNVQSDNLPNSAKSMEDTENEVMSISEIKSQLVESGEKILRANTPQKDKPQFSWVTKGSRSSRFDSFNLQI